MSLPARALAVNSCRSFAIAGRGSLSAWGMTAVTTPSSTAMAPTTWNISRPDGVLRSRMLLGLRQASVPSHAEVSECGAGVPQRQAELADLPLSKQDCEPPPQADLPDHRTHRSSKQLRLGRGAEHCRGSCGTPACRTTSGTPRPATGGCSVAAIAERRRVEKADSNRKTSVSSAAATSAERPPPRTPPCRLLVDPRLCFHVRLCRSRSYCALCLQLEHGVFDVGLSDDGVPFEHRDRKSTRLNSSHRCISY